MFTVNSKYPIVTYLGAIVKSLLTALLVAAIIYLLLAGCNWSLNPANWNGLSRFIGVIGVLIVIINTYDDLRKDRRRYRLDVSLAESIDLNLALKPKQPEKSNEQIQYEMTCMRLATGEYRSYDLGSVGNIIHWLRGYGLIQYDLVQIGQDEITLSGNRLASYKLDRDNNMPIFTFIESFKWVEERQQNYIKCLRKYPNPYK